MRRNFLLLLVIVVFGAGFFVVSGPFVSARGAASAGLSETLHESGSFFDRLFERVKSSEDFEVLIRENEQLKAELLFLRKEPVTHDENGGTRISAKIYSTYPFNHRGLLAVNAGARDGVQIGMPVTVEGTIFLGQVTEVYPRISVIRTLFDADWQVPIKIGDDHTNGLLVGGREPMVTLVARELPLEPGMEIYAASRDFPYGLKIGEATHIRDSAGTNFKEANIRPAFDAGVITDVVILAR